MRTATFFLAGATAIPVLMSTACAQQTLTGTITTLDRLTGTITIQQNGGTSAPARRRHRRVQGPGPPAARELACRRRVSFTVSESGGTKTITKLGSRSRSRLSVLSLRYLQRRLRRCR